MTWYTSGLGYVMSVMLEQQNSMVASVAVCLVLGGFFNGIEPRFRTLSSFMKVVFGAHHPLLHPAPNTRSPRACSCTLSGHESLPHDQTWSSSGASSLQPRVRQ